jgi:hypothetical protein
MANKNKSPQRPEKNPGGPIEAFPFGSFAVEFAAYSYLSQAPSAMPNMLTLSGSAWFRIPFGQALPLGVDANPTLINLFEILPPAATSFGDETCFLDISYDSDSGKAYITILLETSETTYYCQTIDPGFSVPNLAYGKWHHIAYAVDINHASCVDINTGASIDPPIGNFVVDGVNFIVGNNQQYPFSPPGPGAMNWFGFNTTTPIPIAPTPLNGQLIGVPTRFAAGGVSSEQSEWHPIVELGDYQFWAGKYIDFSTPWGGGYSVNPNQPQAGGRPVDLALLNQVMYAAQQAGLNPTYVFTTMNIESAYGTQKGIFKNPTSTGDNSTGIFSFSIDAMAATLGTPDNMGYAGEVWKNQNQWNAFMNASLNAADIHAVPTYSYMSNALLWNGVQYDTTDPSGRYVYLGQLGIDTQTTLLSSVPSTVINTIQAPIQGFILDQAWAAPGGNPPSEYGLPKILATDTLAAWFSNYNTYWNNKMNDANSRISSTNSTYLNAFITPPDSTGKRYPVAPVVAQQLFGASNFLFSGDATINGFQKNKNQAEGGAFTLNNGPLINVSPPP